MDSQVTETVSEDDSLCFGPRPFEYNVQIPEHRLIWIAYVNDISDSFEILKNDKEDTEV